MISAIDVMGLILHGFGNILSMNAIRGGIVGMVVVEIYFVARTG